MKEFLLMRVSPFFAALVAFSVIVTVARFSVGV